MANWLASLDAVILFTGSAILDCNEAALHLFGYSAKFDILVQSPVSLLQQEQADSLSAPERLMMMIAKAQQDGVCKGVVTGHKADGSSFYVNLILMNEIRPNGEGELYCTKWVPMRTFDMGQAMPDVGCNQQLLVNKTSGLLHIGGEGEILYVNETLCAWLGYTHPEMVLGYTLEQLLVSDFMHLLKREESHGDKGVVHGLGFRTKSGTLINLQATVRNINGSGNLYMQLKQEGVADLENESDKQTLDRLKLENKSLKSVQRILQKNMERLRVLSESSPDVIMQFDRQHRHLFVNSQAEYQTPFTVQEFLGKTHYEIGFPDDFSLLCEEILEKVFQTGQRQRIDLQLPNGHWIDWFLIPECSPGGEVLTVITTARDITEKKHTEAELQQSQQRLRDACEVTKLSSWEYVVEQDMLLLNEELRYLLGIEEPLGFMGGKEFLDEFLVAEEQGKLRFLMRAATELKHIDFKEVIDHRLRKRDGTLMHVLSSIRLEVGATGEIIRAYGTAQDITLLRLTEQELEEYRTGLEQLVESRTQELRKSEEKLADALRLANLGTWEFDPVAECFLVSDNVLEIFGTTHEIEVGTMIPVSRMRDSILREDWPKYLATVDRMLAAQDDFYTEHFELRIRRINGEVRHLYVSIKIGKTRNFIKYYGTLQDITVIRETEHEKDRLTAIIETTSDIVGIAGLDGQVLYLNKAGKDFFGIRPDEALFQKNLNNFQHYKFTKVLSRKELRHADKWGTWSGQNRYLRHDGREIYVSQVIISHKSPEGQVQCYSTILRDMSEQKKIEQDLIFKNTELDTFIYRASHDLRGPIATLMGLNQIVRYEVTDETSLKYIDLYNSQIVRLHNITVSLIELTKIKDRNCEISEINFSDLWLEVKQDIKKLPESIEVDLYEQLEGVGEFRSDAHLLKVVLYNLIENAIRYRRSEVDSFARLEIQKVKESSHVVIKVSDNGIGIDGELQNKIYNMFFRGTERSKGPGLGLYILKNAVEKLHGRITLFSVPYKGTTFKIELPSLPADSCSPA